MKDFSCLLLFVLLCFVVNGASTKAPTSFPSKRPTSLRPSKTPTIFPSNKPTKPTRAPTQYPNNNIHLPSSAIVDPVFAVMSAACTDGDANCDLPELCEGSTKLVVFEFQAPEAGDYEFTTDNINDDGNALPCYDTTLTAFANGEYTCNDDANEDTVASAVTLTLSAGEKVVLYVGGYFDECFETTTVSMSVKLASATRAPGTSLRPSLSPTQPPRSFNIKIVFDRSTPKKYRKYFQSAVARWKKVIVAGYAGSVQVTKNEKVTVCDYEFPTNAKIDDILIYAAVIPIDGADGTVGQARRCIVDNLLRSRFGIMRFDSDDIDDMIAVGNFEAVVLHEMGHVFGIGSGWNYLTRRLVDDSQVLPLGGYAYLGAFGNQANEDIGKSGPLVIEDVGSAGTAKVHFKESIYGSELMTGFVDEESNPLSFLTVGTLQDLGYKVDYTKADFFFPPPVARLRRITPCCEEYATDLADFTEWFETTVTGDLVVADPVDACAPLNNNVEGKIVLIARNTCDFSAKTLFAQQAGAIGVVIYNNVPGGAQGMGGDEPTINIPAFSCSQQVGLDLTSLVSLGQVVLKLSNIYDDEEESQRRKENKGIHLKGCLDEEVEPIVMQQVVKKGREEEFLEEMKQFENLNKDQKATPSAVVKKKGNSLK